MQTAVGEAVTVGKQGGGLGGGVVSIGEGEEEVLLYFGIIDILQVWAARWCTSV